ncbi:uncharacterized protein LOC143046466 [Mytilus galloprovincialis]|uniref:uncharacterized protein LOC143046466 n=1 Tax=Mytilus galloprovincialis TaxID=29158 RepID=UPI003F7BEEC9
MYILTQILSTPHYGDKGTTNPYSSTISAVENSSTVPIVAGSVGEILGIVIILVILIVIKRRKNQNHKPMNTTVDQRQPHSYSEPVKNTIQEDSRKLVNVTEEGIYNHLGDSEKNE